MPIKPIKPHEIQDYQEIRVGRGQGKYEAGKYSFANPRPIETHQTDPRNEMLQRITFQAILMLRNRDDIYDGLVDDILKNINEKYSREDVIKCLTALFSTGTFVKYKNRFEAWKKEQGARASSGVDYGSDER